MSDPRPIGMFDSGLGGLTVMREIARLMPDESFVYLGDTARVPYGSRSNETITRFGMQDAAFLLARDIKMLIVACNTVSSVALDAIQSAFPELPVTGVVLPGARAAVMRTAEKKVGVIGTHATIRTQSYVKAIHNIDKTIKVYGKPCPLLVPLVEEGLTNTSLTRQVVQHYLYEMVDIGIDCLILGCTHYPLLMEVIQETVGTRIHLLDSALWAAKEAQDLLVNLDSLAPAGAGGSKTFLVTDVTPHFKEQAGRFLGAELSDFQKIDMEELARIDVRVP